MITWLEICSIRFRKTNPMGLPIQPAPLELFFDGRPMTLARYPNDGWLNILDVPQSGKQLIHEGVTHTPKDGVPRGRHYERFTYSGDRANRWTMHDDIWMHGYWLKKDLTINPNNQCVLIIPTQPPLLGETYYLCTNPYNHKIHLS